MDNTLTVLINQLTALSERVILVLDDYHVIDNGAIHAALTFLLEHLPPNVTLALLTRSDPPLPLARLRARNELLEVRADVLRFSIEEIGQFLNQIMRLNLPDQMVRALDARTEGWIAGLQLAALAMGGAEDRNAFIHDFTGSHRFVLDYLIEEVLSRQPEAVQRFLVQTAILHRLTASLCDAVTGESSGQAMLDYLERNNLFLIPLDQVQHWYRYHHLFADLLQARFQTESDSQRSELYLRAAIWHEHNAFAEEAVRYALDAYDYEYAAHLITSSASDTSFGGSANTLLGWYRAFPPEFVQGHLRLAAHFGVAFALSGHWQEAETLHTYVEQSDQALPAEALPLAYVVATSRRDIAQLAALTNQAMTSFQSDPSTKLVLALLMTMSGKMQQAVQLLDEAYHDSQRLGRDVIAQTILFQQCRLLVYAGQLQQAYKVCQQALQSIREAGSATLPMATLVHSALGRVFIEWNELDRADEHLTQVLPLSERSGFLTGMMSSTTIMLAEVKQARGDFAGAIRDVQTAIAYAERYDPAHEVALLKAYGARIWLAQGNIEMADEWMQPLQNQPQPVSMFYPSDLQTLIQARLLWAQRKTDEAIGLLTYLTAKPPTLLSIDALTLLAVSRQTRGDSVNAMITLEQALAVAEPENRVHTFLDHGAPMAKLLARFCEGHPDHGFARKLLAAFPALDNPPRAVELALSDRELEVLRLIVAGKSNEEIAQTLTLALSTVKWYVNVLYGKLQVKTRSQAIARTHELKLLAH